MPTPVTGGTAHITLNGGDQGTFPVVNGAINPPFSYTPGGGPDTIAVTYSGVPGQFTGSSGQYTQVNNNPVLPTAVVVSGSPNPGTIGQPVTVNISITSTP